MKLRLPLCVGLSALLSMGHLVSAQSPITKFSAYYQSTTSSFNLYSALPVNIGTFSGCSGSLFSYSYGNGSANQLRLNNFTVNGNTFLVAPAGASTVKLRRVNNTQVTGSRNIVYMETTASTATACPSLLSLNFKPPYKDVMEDVLAAGMLNQGTDNLFTNTSNLDGNINNIERVDVIFADGLNTAVPTQAGFAIFDRGANNGHDAFRIAAVTAVDDNGNPTAFGSIKSCIAGNGSNNGSWGHPTTANGNRVLPSYVLRKDASDPFLKVSSSVNQELGGVFFTFADLGIKAGQPLYGYALLAPDGGAAPSSAQLLDINDASVYPTSTTEASGGLDLVAVNTVFATGSYVVLSLPDNKPTPPPQQRVAPDGWKIFPTMPQQGQSLKLQGLHDGNYILSYFGVAGSRRNVPVKVAGGEANVAAPTAPGMYWVLVSIDGQPIAGKANVLVR